MPFKIGDRVKYLNEEGGGKILRLLDNEMVVIEDDNGFEFTVPFSDIVAENKSSINQKSIKDKLKGFNTGSISAGTNKNDVKSDYNGVVREYLLESKKYWTSKKNNFIEVDLHIEAFTKNPRSLTDGQKLHHQLEHANKCLNAAMDQRILHIVFIHGVGAGVLRNELRKWLQTLSYISFENADYTRYGIGATQVRVHGAFSGKSGGDGL